MNRRSLGLLALAAYAGTVLAANWFVQHVGQTTPGGGPHTIPVGFGYRAPSGVLWIGLAFTMRDIVQSTIGKRAVLAGIALGALLSYAVTPALAFASAAAFLVSEALDFAVYTPLMERRRPLAALLLSNTVGLLADTVLFLQLAFGSLHFWQGQVLGKLWMTVLAAAAIFPVRTRLSAGPGRASSRSLTDVS